MDCSPYLETVSADLDGEASVEELDALTRHLESCTSCNDMSSAMSGLHRVVRVRGAEPTPNLVPAVLGNARSPRLGRWQWVRYSLGVVAATNLVLGLPQFLFGAAAEGHESRHLGAFTIAVSIGLLFAAIRPERAYGLLPFAAALGLTMVTGAVIDMLGAQRSVLAESAHVLDLLGLVLLWYLAGGGQTWSKPTISLRPAGLSL